MPYRTQWFCFFFDLIAMSALHVICITIIVIIQILLKPLKISILRWQYLGYSKPKYSYIIVENICCFSGSLMLFIYSTQTFILIDSKCDRKYYIITNYLIHFFIQFNYQMFPWKIKCLIMETVFHWFGFTLVFLITSCLSCVRLSVCLSVCLSLNVLSFRLLFHDQWTNFIQTWHEVSFGEGDSKCFFNKWQYSLSMGDS